MAQDTFVAMAIQSSGTTWAQFKTGGVKVIADKLAAANPAKANPTTTATVAPTGGGSTGGSLAAGTYYFAYTFVDCFGETLAGGESAQVTVGATNIPRVTLPALPTGVDSINLYLTAAGGGVGTEKLYATGITTTTFDCSYAAPSDVATPTLPAANGTGMPDVHGFFASVYDCNPELTFASFSAFINAFLQGDPMERRHVFRQAKRMIGVMRTILPSST